MESAIFANQDNFVQNTTSRDRGAYFGLRELRSKESWIGFAIQSRLKLCHTLKGVHPLLLNNKSNYKLLAVHMKYLQNDKRKD